jgi:hypothetical protein
MKTTDRHIHFSTILKIGFAYLIFTSLVYSQVLFEKRYGGGGEERATSIELTSDGGYIICGSTSSYGAGSHDIYIVKIDSIGNLEWSRTYGGTGEDRAFGIKQTSDNSYFIIATWPGDFGLFDALVMKIDSVGNQIWATNIGSSSFDELRGMSITSDGGILVSGYTSFFGFGSKDIYLIKFTDNGIKEWEKVLGSSLEDHNFANFKTSDGNYILAGFSMVDAWWDATLIKIDTKVIKTDTTGSVMWAKSYGGGAQERVHSLIETSDGGFIVVGQTNSYGSGGDDILIFCTDSVGTILWAKAYGDLKDETAYSIIQDLDGNFIVAGWTSSFGIGEQDAFLMKLNSTGDILWFKTYGGSHTEYAFDVKLTDDHGFIMLGWSNSGSLGNYDIYIVKTDSLGTSQCPSEEHTPTVIELDIIVKQLTIAETNGGWISTPDLISFQPNTLMSQLCSIVSVEVINNNIPLDNYLEQNYPNPFNSKTIINYSVKTEGYISLSVFDVLGNKVTTLVDEEKSAGNYKVEFDGSDLSSGVYYYVIQTGEFISTKKLVLLK